jgi:MFS family permease
MYTIIALAVADTLIEFRFLTVTDLAFTDQASYQRFFSAYRLGITILSLIVQAFVTGYLIKKMQLKNTFVFFPIVALLGTVGMIFIPGVGMAIAAMASVKLIRDTVNESGRKSFQGLVPEERRGRVSTLMESYLPAIGTMLASILGIIVIYVGGLLGFDNILVYIYMGIAALGAIVAFWAVLRMRNVYDSSLLNWRLKRRQRRAQTALLDKLSD